MAGFEFAYLANGGTAPTIQTIVAADAEVFTAGEIVNLESGELDAGASGDTAFVGAVVQDLNNAGDGLSCAVITDQDAVYSVVDDNLRLQGATLDLAVGGLGVTTSSNADFIVVKTSSATERTLVMFNNTHYLD